VVIDLAVEMLLAEINFHSSFPEVFVEKSDGNYHVRLVKCW
jgi:hypothetical protein